MIRFDQSADVFSLYWPGCTAAAEAAGKPEGRSEAVRAQAQEEGEGGQRVDQGTVQKSGLRIAFFVF
jgi:hypothetical protein